MKKFFLLLCITLSASASASVVIMGTRVIYPEGKKSIDVQLNNGDSSPSLIQSWIDDGNASAAPDSVKVPFIITPPIFRMEPRTGQTLRIMYTGESLAKDRESIFWLNVLDIPAKPKTEEKDTISHNNYLQLAVRSRIKFFFRPENIKLSPGDSYEKVVWSIEEKASGSFLKVNNPTPYFITYNQIAVTKNGKTTATAEGGMVSPFSSKAFPLHTKATSGDSVQWVIVNDYGGYQKGRAVLK
ncbi:fimbria/pilus periplasmic chaperone [Salmonella enterica subsp. enterica serovar Montevideo]|nr:fimbria/pilus periplasmic chaperone [Salmonella enterica subsp. enterica serovar Montevideo]EEK7812161.1 fimbria/pilus periplasmic chaperone [Salmonella enterica subsp. enterica serovar Montevideo]